MKNKKLNLVKNTALFLFALCISFTADAQEGEHKKGGKEAREKQKAFREEMREYVRENVCPTVAGQRAKLEQKMSLEDKNRIAEIRKELRAIREKGREARKLHRAALKKGQNPERPLEEQRQKCMKPAKK